MGDSAPPQEPDGLTDQGAITKWLLLGPFDEPYGCGNTDLTLMQQDFLTDGTIDDELWTPLEGEQVDSDCGGAALCNSWLCDRAANVDPAIDCTNPIPTVHAYNTPETDGIVDLNSIYVDATGAEPDNVITYAWTYVNNTTGDYIKAFIGHNSDDSFRILFNFQEPAGSPAYTCRGYSRGTYDQEQLGPVFLNPGPNVIMTTTFDGCCDHGFRVRLMDADTGLPLQNPEIEIDLGNPPSPEDIRIRIQRILPASYSPGDTITVDLDIEVLDPPIDEVEVRERIPSFFHASFPSPPGTIEEDAKGRQTVVWKITGGVDSQTLSYDLEIPDPYANVTFRESFFRADGKPYGIFGQGTLTGGSPARMTEALVVSLLQPTGGGGAPGEDAMRWDYITNGDDLSEEVVVPVQGEAIIPDFGGESPSPGPLPSPTSLVWTRFTDDGNGLMDLFPDPPNPQNIVTYVAFYIVNPLDETVRVKAGAGSDDAIQILLDGEEILIHNIGRGGSATPQDRSELFDLTPGKHLCILKIFQGCCGHSCSFRLEDEDNQPVAFPYTLDPLADPPYEAGRAFVLRNVPDDLDVGESGTISIKLRVRDDIQDAVIQETAPESFTISEISDGGVQNGQQITWTVTGALENHDFTYRVDVPGSALDGDFDGVATVGGQDLAIIGDTTFRRGVMTPDGFIKQWLVMGPLDTQGLWFGDPLVPPTDIINGPSATPENGDIRLDWLTDGVITEQVIRPFDGMRIAPVFLGPAGDGIDSSRANYFEILVRPCAPEEPTWEKFVTSTTTFNNNDYFGEEIDSHTTYAACYITNPGQEDLSIYVAFHSDDAFIVYLDGIEASVYEPPPCSGDPAVGCGRGYGAEGEVANFDPITIPPGEHFLLTRVHDGYGGSGHRLRFQDAPPPVDPGDPEPRPILPPQILVSLESRESPPPAKVTRRFSSTVIPAGSPLAVTLKVEADGSHDVDITEILPPEWTAHPDTITGGGALNGDQIEWSLRGVVGEMELTYELAPVSPCPGGSSFCGNGLLGSTYIVDGALVHSLKGDEAFGLARKIGNDPFSQWDSRDIGPEGGGAVRIDDNAVDVAGVGQGLIRRDDEFHFVSHAVTGDFEIEARIDCMDAWGGQAGLMVRSGFDQDSAHIFLGMEPDPQGAWILRGVYRQGDGLNSRPATIQSDQEVDALPLRLRMSRTAGVYTLERSDPNDVDSFITLSIRDDLSARVEIGDEAHVGLAVTGGGLGMAKVSFREVSSPPFDVGGEPVPVFKRGDVDGNGAIELTDVIRALTFQFVGGVAIDCQDTADVDDDGQITLTDAIRSLNYQFAGIAGAVPESPGPLACGPDVNDDALPPCVYPDTSCR